MSPMHSDRSKDVEDSGEIVEAHPPDSYASSKDNVLLMVGMNYPTHANDPKFRPMALDVTSDDNANDNDDCDME
jgi:hypothetical protein